MSFLGMGIMEILIILIIAFIFLGPERMIDVARMLGRLVREARSVASEIPRVVVEDDDIKIVNGGETTSLTGQPAQPPPAKPSAAARAAAPEAEADAETPDGGGGPVAFSRRSAPETENGENRPDRTDR